MEKDKSDRALGQPDMVFKILFNESMNGMLLAEVDSRRFIMCNPRICKMLGYTEEEMLRLSVDDIHPESDLPLAIEQFELHAKGDAKVVAGIPVKRKDGSVFYADIDTSLVTLSGKKCLIGSFRDVTEDKKIQDELLQKMRDLELFAKCAVDRELKMEALENKIKLLEEKLKRKQ